MKTVGGLNELTDRQISSYCTSSGKTSLYPRTSVSTTAATVTTRKTEPVTFVPISDPFSLHFLLADKFCNTRNASLRGS
jgi:hypothetical protein